MAAALAVFLRLGLVAALRGPSAPPVHRGGPCASLPKSAEDVLDDSYWRQRQQELQGLKFADAPQLVNVLQLMVARFKESIVSANCKDASRREWAAAQLNELTEQQGNSTVMREALMRLMRNEELPKLKGNRSMAVNNATLAAVAHLKKLMNVERKVFRTHLGMDHAGMHRVQDAIQLVRAVTSGHPLSPSEVTGGRSLSPAESFEKAKRMVLKLCAEALEARSPAAPAPSLAAEKRLEDIAISLDKVAEGAQAPNGTRKLVDDIRRALADVRGMRDEGKIEMRLKTAATEVADYSRSLDRRMHQLARDRESDDLRMNGVSENKRSEELFKGLYEIQDESAAEQLAYLESPRFRGLPVVAALSGNHSTDTPLAIQVGRWLDESKRRMKEQALEKHRKKIGAIKDELKRSLHVDDGKASALARIVNQLEGRIGSVQAHEQNLVREDQFEMERAQKRHRLFIKQKANDNAELHSLQQAISGIKAGKPEGLQSAMRELSKLAQGEIALKLAQD